MRSESEVAAQREPQLTAGDNQRQALGETRRSLGLLRIERGIERRSKQPLT